MTSELDPLDEPLRLLRETSLTAGFEERLAERLSGAKPQAAASVLRWPGRRRTWLLLAAVALSATAAAATRYWFPYLSATNSAARSPTSSIQPRLAKPLGPLPNAGIASGVQMAVPAAPTMTERPPIRTRGSTRSREPVSKLEARDPTLPRPNQTRTPPQSTPSPNIESLDVFVPRSSKSPSSMALPSDGNASDSLRRATARSASQSSNESARGQERDIHSGQNRGSESAGQARERVQARERKGQ